MDIYQLVNVTDPKEKNNCIIELADYVAKRCNFGENISVLTEQEKNFFYNQELEMEINNGGLHQYLFNLSGNFVHETIESLKNVKANKTANILQKAIDLFPNKSVPKNQTERQNILERFSESAIELLNELDKDFYQYEDDLNTLNLEYIKQNIDGFPVKL